MAEKEIIISLNGGVNLDESILNPPAANRGISSFELGDYRYILNMRLGSSIADNIGSPENIPSTYNDVAYYAWDGAAFVSAAVPTGTNTAFGKPFEDKANGKIYYTVYNASGNHTVLCYSKLLRQTHEILQWSGLNFNTASHVSMCKVGKYLILADRRNPNRILDVDGGTNAIYETKRVLGVNFSEFHISFAKWPPLAPIQVTSDAVTASDYLEKGIFQFTYRYIYKGGFKSTFAPFSPFVTNEGAATTNAFLLSIPGFFFDYETPASTSFGHSSIKFYDVVDYIEFVYRESTRDPWKLFKRHTVTSTPPTTIRFENNGPTARIPDQDIGMYFDSVPFLSGACESIDNRVMFGDNRDELPAVTDFDVEDIAVHSVNPSSDSWNGPSTAFSSLSVGQRTALALKLNIQQKSFKERAIYKLGIVFQHFSGRTNLVTTLDKWTYVIPSSASTTPSVFERYHALGFNIPAGVSPPDWAVAYQIVRSNAIKIELFVHGIANDFKFLANDDNGVNDAVATPTTMKDLMNTYFDNNPLASITQSLFKKKLALIDRTIADQRKSKEVTITNASRIYIDISNWFLTPSKEDPVSTSTADWPANSLYYNFQKGDRVRFRGSLTVDYDVPNLVTFDEEIVEFTGKGVIVNKPATLVTLKARADGGVNPSQSYFIEIYRPSEYNPEETVVYHEIGEWYPITQPRTASRDFAKRDFRWSSASAVTLSTVAGFSIYNKMPISNGDVWMVDKSFYFNKKGSFSGEFTGGVFPQMTQDKERAWDFWEKGVGRPYVAYSYLPTEEDKLTQIRFGGKLLQDTLFLSINTFRDEDQHYYPSEYGRIRTLINVANAQVESVGSILLAIGEIEAWSIYVNRTTLEDLSGRSQVSLSDKVLGSYNVLLGQQGTLNPDSVSAKNGRALWWNASVGEWVRYSRDGLTEISDFGLKNWFKDLSDLLINKYASVAPKVLSTFDDYHKCWITYINHADLPATFKGYSSYKCVTFAERNADKRWKEWFDYTPELFASMDNEVYSIIGTKVYIHEEGDDFGSIYGVKKDSYIEVVANPEVRKNKTWKALALESSDKWSFESVKGDWRSNGATQQETRMRTDDLEKKEWTFWTAIKKDKNTPNAASEQAAVVNGEGMRSKSLRILMKLDPAVDYYTIFNYLVLTYDDSSLNPKK